jgi:hypothetical protein
VEVNLIFRLRHVHELASEHKTKVWNGNSSYIVIFIYVVFLVMYNHQGCHKERFWRKITVQTSARVRVYPADAVLPADGFLPSADAVETASARTRKIKKIKIKF